jgi:short-subunit dehydrogenase
MIDGKIDGLFNNGAFGQPGAVEDLSRDVLREQFETNFFGTHELTNLIIPLMRKQGYGRIIYNSSILGFVAMRYRGAYNASKYALEGLVDTMRIELYDTNIKLCLIEPGPITSNFRKNAYAMYLKNINPESSFHKNTYKAMEERLQKEGPAAPFTLPPEAVAKKVIHALESKNPKIRYYVTFPTYLFGYLKRLLPMAWLDVLLRKAQ